MKTTGIAYIGVGSNIDAYRCSNSKLLTFTRRADALVNSLAELAVHLLDGRVGAGLSAHSAQAQTAPSATRTGHALWVGGEYSNISTGFPYASGQRLWGAGAFADYHLTGHIGLEAEARFLRFNSFYGETEDNYLAGPRYLPRNLGSCSPIYRKNKNEKYRKHSNNMFYSDELKEAWDICK